MKWFFETLYDDVKIGLKGKLLFEKKTPYQNLEIFENKTFGKVLMLDGAIQTTTKDEFIYHEMMTHPVLTLHPNPKKILVIGAGDGGILREILKHKCKEIVIVEIDREVIELSKKFLPSIGKGAFSNKRVKILIEDGAKFVEETKEKFDIAIIDSPDPIGVAKVLFSKKFYRNIFSVLNKEGIMIRQSGSTILQKKELKQNYRLLKELFPYVCIQIAAIPTYIGGFFSFIIASKKINPYNINFKKLEEKYNNLKAETKYYNPYIHIASLSLPNYIKNIIGDDVK